VITNFKIFENDININYKKGYYILYDNEVQIIQRALVVGHVTSSVDKSKIGEKLIHFDLYNPFSNGDKFTSIKLYESEIILPTKDQILEFENYFEAMNKLKKYNL
jgi:hypothetical protein